MLEEDKQYQELFYNLKGEEQEFAGFLFGEKGLSFESVKQYLIYFRAWKKGNFELNIPSARAYVGEFRGNSARFFLKRYCEFKGMAPLVGNPSGKVERKQGDVITEEEYEKIRTMLYKRGIKYGLIGDIQFYSGARRSEVLKMRTDDINAKEWDAGKKLRIKVSAKGSTRLIVIPARTAENLMNYIAELVNERIIYLEANPVILQRLGKSRWASVLADASLKAIGRRISTHTLRRSRATLWHRSGIPVEVIQRRLGHANLNTTMIYVKMDSEEILSQWEGEEDG